MHVRLPACLWVCVCIHWTPSITQAYQIGQLADVAGIKCQTPKPWACSQQLEKTQTLLYVGCS